MKKNEIVEGNNAEHEIEVFDIVFGQDKIRIMRNGMLPAHTALLSPGLYERILKHLQGITIKTQTPTQSQKNERK